MDVYPRCPHFDSNYCRSCGALAWRKPAAGIAERKTSKLIRLLKPLFESDTDVAPTEIVSSPLPSRAKVKAAVTGTVSEPTVGLIDPDYSGRPLVDCPLHISPLNSILSDVQELIPEFGILPYDIIQRRGELKHVIATTNISGDQNIVRFVLRSDNQLLQIRKLSEELCKRIPSIQVLSVNIQPLPAAIIEGDEELPISRKTEIWEDYEGVKVAFSARSFVQVTPLIASRLYSYARSVLDEMRPQFFIDLFCGTGAFSLVSRGSWNRHLGIEITEDAVRCAKLGAERNDITDCRFEMGDLTQSNELARVLSGADCVLVNPPRRGLGSQLLQALETATPEYILYSSCNPLSLHGDLLRLSSKYTLKTIKPFDMFPLTEHIEGFCVLRRRPKGA